MISSLSPRPTNPRLALVVIAVVFAILNADITTVNVALVTLGKDLHADLNDLQWGLNSYMLAFAALIVAAGRLADVFGRRRCLLAGAILFAVASLLCGIAPTLSLLVIGRVLQGAAGYENAAPWHPDAPRNTRTLRPRRQGVRRAGFRSL